MNDITRQELMDGLLADRRKVRRRVLISLGAVVLVGLVAWGVLDHQARADHSLAEQRAFYNQSETAHWNAVRDGRE